MIKLRHLNLSVAPAEAGNLSKGAKRVHLSQPATSQQIKTPKKSVGTESFKRKSHPLRLTPTGHRLLGVAHFIQKLFKEATRDLDRIA